MVLMITHVLTMVNKLIIITNSKQVNETTPKHVLIIISKLMILTSSKQVSKKAPSSRARDPQNLESFCWLACY